ncbi:hypothetical protein AFAEC_0594 [Aliarcobacter faecis]|uniref:hypothetical protein n=1 Tax=Aliarcobacter faecis TaxID=1564138 RepID=UPI00047D8ED2|nr:hypothetical protein [Aliarcobacter faecis]QKF72785.1 hypothetical protein AFAEC_0594 [Aliarcobacter faecis]
MKLEEAKQKIIEAIELDENSYEIKLIERQFQGISKYIAIFGIISKTGLIDDVVIEKIVSMIESGNDNFKIEKTQLNMKDMDFDILLINAEINLR